MSAAIARKTSTSPQPAVSPKPPPKAEAKTKPQNSAPVQSPKSGVWSAAGKTAGIKAVEGQPAPAKTAWTAGAKALRGGAPVQTTAAVKGGLTSLGKTTSTKTAEPPIRSTVDSGGKSLSKASVAQTVQTAKVSKLNPTQLRELGQLKQAKELAPLANAVYDDAKTPKGYRRASTDPAALKKLGLTAKDLDPKDPKSGFKAEVFLPENGKGKPVVSFRGTNTRPDAASNGKQLLGLPEESYTQAMDLATKLKKNGVDAQFTGHSLGGGLAASAARATGKDATTFNAAGLNPNTVPDYLNRNNQPNIIAGKVNNIAVQGDIVTELQTRSKDLGPETARVLAGTASNAQKVLKALDERKSVNPLLGSGSIDNRNPLISKNEDEFLQALGQNADKLRNTPAASGETLTVPARNKDGSERSELALNTAFLGPIEHEITDGKYSKLGDVAKAGVIYSEAKRLAPQLAKHVNESIERHGLYQESIDARIKQLESQS